MTLELGWPEIVVSALALTSVGQRALKWCWAHRQIVRALHDHLELWAHAGSHDAEAIKREMNTASSNGGGAMRRQADRLALWAESRTREATATIRRQERTPGERAAAVVKGIARWLPVVGALLD